MYFAVVSSPPPLVNDAVSEASDCGDTRPRIVRVQNDNGEGRVTSMPVSGDSTGHDLLECVRDPGYLMVHLVARCSDTDILVLPTDNICALLRELDEEDGGGGAGSAGGSVGAQFVVRYEHTDTPDGFCLSTEGRRSHHQRSHSPSGIYLSEPQWSNDVS